MPIKKIVLFVAGFALVIGGIALTLKYWAVIKMMFWAVIGPLLAVAGLVVLAMSRD